MAAKIATAEITEEVVHAGYRFGHNGRRGTGSIVRLHGIAYLEGSQLAKFGQTYREICYTCYGTGFRPEYAGIFAGECFPCSGNGYGRQIGSGTLAELTKVLRRRQRDRERREAARVAKVERQNAERTAGLAAWQAANAHLAGVVAEYGRFIACEHWSLTSGPCYREACEAARHEAEETRYPELLTMAYTAMWRPLDASETAWLEELARRQAAREEKLAAKTAVAATREWLGAEGEKITVTGTLAAPMHFDTEIGYGRTRTSTLYRLTTAEGNTVSWFRTGFHTFNAGDVVTLAGTVKALKHTEKYGKETQLTRCKIS